MEKRKIDGREVLNDIRSGMEDAFLMRKYRLSSKGLVALFGKLVQSGLITQGELDLRSEPLSQRTVSLVLWKCPACGAPDLKEHEVCPHCGIIVSKFEQQHERIKDEVENYRNRPKEEMVRKTFKIGMTSWWEIERLGGDPSYHVNEAIKLYLDVLKEKKAGAKPAYVGKMSVDRKLAEHMGVPFGAADKSKK